MSNYSNNNIKDDPNHVWNKILNFIPKGSTVLDIGCSSGNLGDFLINERKCLVDGVEPDTDDYRIAKTILNNVWNSDIETALDNITGKYDILIFADVLEHILFPDRVLMAVKKLLKQDGEVIFSVPNMAHISTRLGLLEGNFSYTETGILDKTHLHFWNMETVTQVLKNSGMRLLDLDAVIYKYSKKLINKRLNGMGLTANDEAIRLLTDISSSAFQFVGRAEYSSLSQKKIVLPKELLEEDIQMLVDKDLSRQQETIDNFHKQILADQKYVKTLEATINDMKKTIKTLEATINDMKKTIAYKLSRIINKIKQT